MPETNHFATLDLKPGADENAVKKAYRTLAKKWHPDKNSDPGAKEKFQEIAAAYEYLSSKDRREMLERELRKASQPQPQTSQTTGYYKPNTYTSQTTNPAPETSSSKPSQAKTKKNKKPNAGTWSETFTKNYRNKEKKNDKFNQSSHEQADDEDRPGYSNSYSSQRRGQSPPFKFDNDIFDELLSDFYRTMGFIDPMDDFLPMGGTPPPKKRTRPRNVAPETGKVDGLDEEYLFTSRKEDSEIGEKLPCPWCGQLFTRGKLGQHEEKCGKFGLSADESEDDSNDSDLDDYDPDLTPSYHYAFARPGQQTNWQRQHEEFLHRVRQDRRRYQDRMASQGQRNAGYIQCPYCERSFSQMTSVKHIPWCKEHTQRYGKPLNPRSPFPESPSSREKAERAKARERAKEYAKTVPKPDAKKNTFRGSQFDDSFEYDGDETSAQSSPRDGNSKKFPYSRPKMTKSGFGVWGHGFGGQEDQDDLFSNATTSARTSRASSGMSDFSATKGQDPETNSYSKSFNTKTEYTPRGAHYNKTYLGAKVRGGGYRGKR